jgi:hypothetical protein
MCSKVTVPLAHGHHGGAHPSPVGVDGVAETPEAHMEANRLTTTTVVVTVPTTAEFAQEVIRAGRGGSPEFAAMCERVADRLVAHFESRESESNVSARSATA